MVLTWVVPAGSYSKLTYDNINNVFVVKAYQQEDVTYPATEESLEGGVLKCMLINGGQTKSNGDTVYLRCGSSKYHLLSPLPWAEYKAKRQIRQ